MTRVLGEFVTPDDVVEASRSLSEQGARFEVYTPYPVDSLTRGRSPVALVVLLGALAGALTGYLIQWWCNAVNFPINVGGRPPHAPPSFVPITFELAVLFGAFGAFLTALALSGLPRLHHPVFDVARFRSATLDRFFIALEPDDPANLRQLQDHLRALGASWVGTVEDEA